MVDVPGDEFGEVLAAAKQGDGPAIGRLYAALQPRLLRFLRTQAGDAADDIASQTWLEVVAALHRFEGTETGFRAFVFTVGRRRLADHRRSRRRHPSTPTEPSVMGAAVDPDLDVEADALSGIAADRATRLIAAELTPDQAEVVLLRVVAGLPVEEVARMLGKRPGAVRILQHRGLRRLAEVIEGRSDDQAR